MNGVAPAVADALAALGLLTGDGLDPSWFGEPLARIGRLLSSPAQREAFLRVVRALRPQASGADVPDGEAWHPLVESTGGSATLYLTVADPAPGPPASAETVLGLAAMLSRGTTVLVARLPLVRVGDDVVHDLAGSSDGPLSLDLRVRLDWTRPARSLELQAVRIGARATAAGDAALSLVLERVDVGDGAIRDIHLGPELEGGAFVALVALVRRELEGMGPSADPAVEAVRANLLPLLGLTGTVPPLPFADLGGPGLRAWLAALAAGPAPVWLGHLCGLLGGANAPASGEGTRARPWRSRVVDLTGGGRIDLTIGVDDAAGTARFVPGLAVEVPLPGGASVVATAALFAVPLAGTAPTSPLTELWVGVAAPSGPGPLVATSAVTVERIHAGLRWDGVALGPVVELAGVRLAGHDYPLLDLSSAGAIESAAREIVRDAIVDALGASPAARALRALAGLGAPAGDPAWPHAVDLAAFVADPARAIGAVHRAALAADTHGWGLLFDELADLVGLGGARLGAGSPSDPWRHVVTGADGLALELAAWNARSPTDSTERLRLGLRLVASTEPIEASWLAELIGFDLPATGTGAVRLLGAQRLSLRLAPIPPVADAAGLTFDASSLSFTLDWAPGRDAACNLSLDDVSLAAEGATFAIPSLRFPPDTAGSGAELDAVRRFVLGRAAISWGGWPGLIGSALAGLHRALPGLPSDWPVLAGTGTASWLDDAPAALRAWLELAVTGVSGDGTPFLTQALRWLRALLGGVFPATLSAAASAAPLEGAGRHDDPWVLPLAAGAVDALVWIEPAGPPPAWAGTIATQVAGATGYRTLLDAIVALGGYDPSFRDASIHVDLDTLAAGLRALGNHLSESDGVVPEEAQRPAGWANGVAVHAPHLDQPRDPSAIAQILDQIDAWSPGVRSALLLSPSFATAGAWDDLIAAAVARGHAATDYTAAILEESGAAAELARLVATTGAGPRVLVGHSTAGLAARAFAADSPGAFAGIITLGTPHGGALLRPLRDPTIVAALRFLERTALPASGPVGEAVRHLIGALDPWKWVGAAAPPVHRPYPFEAFAGGAPSADTGGAPALALGGALDVGLLEALRSSSASAVAEVAARTAPAPTHLGFGARARQRLVPGVGGSAVADLLVRTDVGHLALSNAAPPTPRATALTVSARIFRPGGWLVDGPDTRIRWVELGFDVGDESSIARLHQAAHRGRASFVANLDDPLTPPVLDAVFSAADAVPPALREVLRALDVLVEDVHGVSGLSADALTALAIDGARFLEPRLADALGRGALPPFQLGGLSLEIEARPWTLRLRGAAFPPDGPAGGDLDLRIDAGGPATTFAGTLNVGGLELTLGSTGTLIASSPSIGTLSLRPLAPAAELHALVERLLLSGAVTLVLEAAVGPGLQFPPVHAFLGRPGSSMAQPDALGGPAGLDGARVNGLLESLGDLLELGAGPGLPLPGGLRLDASGSDPLVLTLATASPLAGLVSFDLRATIDRELHVVPSGRIELAVALPAAPWASVAVAFFAGPAGIALTITPSGGSAIQLLPGFGGFGALAGSAAALLPQALDALVAALPSSSLRSAALDLAAALGLYDPAGGFSAHAAALSDLGAAGGLGRVASLARPAAASAIAALLSGVAGTVSASEGVASWRASGLPLTLAVGWDAAGPLARLEATGLAVASGGLGVDLLVEHGPAGLRLAAGLALSLQPALALDVTPRFTVEGDDSGLFVALRPLGDDSLVVDIAPSLALHVAAGAPLLVARRLAVPLARRLLIEAAGPVLGSPVWSGGPTLETLLTSAGVLPTSAPLPDVGGLARGLVASIGSMELAPGLRIEPAGASGRVGVRLSGAVRAPAGELELQIRLGAPAEIPDTQPGATVWLFDGSALAPALRLSGVGLRLGRPGGAALVSTGAVRLGAAAGYVFLDVPLDGSAPALRGAALGLEAFGVPLGQARAAGGDNPIAAGLLRSDGGADDEPVAPALDVVAFTLGGVTRVLFEGRSEPITVDVERSFGPLHLSRLSVAPTADPGAQLVLDGRLDVAGLAVSVDDLMVAIPFRHLLAPGEWRLDLRGLAVSLQTAGVSLAGGLTRAAGIPVEYRGVLQGKIAGRSFAAVGAYARPRAADGDDYISFFAFASLGAELGGPPFFSVKGLAGGAGLNRRLRLPARVEEVADHPLVLAVDDGALAADPMSALDAIADFVPPERGAFWLAAGLRFTTYGLVHTRALVHVATGDRGIEVGLMGLSRMVLPSADRALVNVELAVRARYSAEEGLLSVQGQLTDRSWLLDQDCRLTGGFAFFVWFEDWQFLLTLGGYHPSFVRPPHFPEVPRLGFRWRVSDRTTIKGEAYFALTSSCVMAGGRLEVDYLKGGLHAWFEAKANFLIAWDPFLYDIEIGVTVGASLRIRVCFIKCWTTTLGFSIGARLRLAGPPLHGEVSVGLGPVSLTVSFGSDPQPPDYLPTFAAFRDKYLVAGGGEAVALQLGAGLLPGAAPAPGTASEPWRVGPELALTVESRMPATHVRHPLQPAAAAVPGLDELVLAPMGDVAVTRSELALTLEKRSGSSWVAVAASPDGFEVQRRFGRVPEGTWRFQEPGHVAAAASTLQAFLGLSLRTFARPLGVEARIPVSTLVDDLPQYARPLPFARRSASDLEAWRGAGAMAETLASLVAGVPALDAAVAVLAGGGVFAAARASAGLPASGLPPAGVRALRRARSSPPLVAPLSTGLTMRPVGLPPPPARPPSLSMAPVPLEEPRLRAVLRPSAASGAARAARTTVVAPGVTRIRAPRARLVAGARLDRITLAGLARTSAAIAGRSVISPELGGATGGTRGQHMAGLAKQIAGDGVRVPAGVTQIWELPAGEHVVFVGEGRARLTSLGRGGAILDDVELERGAERAIPASAELLAIAGIAAGPPAAAGWQLGTTAVRVGERTFLTPRAALVLSRGPRIVRDDRPAAEALVVLGEMLPEVVAVETWLPTDTSVVAVLLDVLDPTAAERGDLALAVDGARLASSPIRIESRRRRALLYDVVEHTNGARRLVVSTASRAGFRVAAVVGLGGRAEAWAAELGQGPLEAALPAARGPETGTTLVRLKRGGHG